MNLNQPPICSIYLKSQRVQALQLQKLVANCQFSDDYPFTYQLGYFLNEQDYSEFQNQLSDYSLILNGFQRFNYFETLLPYSKGVALVQIMDSRGSITNIEEHLDIQKIELNCTEFMQSNFTYKKQVIMLLEVIMNHYDQEGCVQFQEQLVKTIKAKIDSDDLFEQLLALQTIKVYKRFKVNLSNQNSSARALAEINQESCYDNLSQLFLINNNRTQKYSSTDIPNFVLEFQQLKNSAQKILSKGTNLDDEIKQNDIFFNEQLFQSKQQISNSLVAIILFVDDLFLKISQATFSQKEDKDQIVQLSKDLIALIEEMLEFTNTQVAVNGQDFVLDGQILKYQSAKVTKEVFNQQEGLDKDIMDGLIVYVQKEQMDIQFNYLNASEKHLQDIKTVLNQSSLEIDQNFFTITKLRNYLYKNQYRDYERLNINYLIDITQYPYCVDALLPAYNFQCFQYDNSETLQQCQLQITEINNKSVQVSCQCSQLGIIFMTRYKNSSSDELEIVKILNGISADDTNCNINNQLFLLFHGIYIVFTLFIYYELKKLETPQNIDAQNIVTERSPKSSDQQKKKYDQLKCSPGNLEIFKFSFKFIHEILCLFYFEDLIIPKSYRFLKLSVFLTTLIPLSYFETFFIEIVTFIPLFIINYILLLLLRTIFKIFESIYRFQGISRTIIISVFFLIHLLSYVLSIYLSLLKSQCHQNFNQNISIVLGCSILLSYAIVDILVIYCRIALFRNVVTLMKEDEFNPLNRFFYFFIQHNKLSEIFQEYAVI